jgi:hypothetical protein
MTQLKTLIGDKMEWTYYLWNDRKQRYIEIKSLSCLNLNSVDFENKSVFIG